MDLFVAMRTFVEVSRAGSMNAAALKLNVSSALVGQRIAGLEDHLRTRLLNRTTRQQSLTDFGQIYLEHCQDILELVSISEGKADDQAQHLHGRLRITAPVSFGTAALMPALKVFTKTAPKVEVELCLSDRNEDLLADGFDVAFRVGPLADSSMIQVKLAPYRMVACASPDYLAAHPVPQDPTDLNYLQAVLFTKTGRRPWRFTKGAETKSWAPKAAVSVNSGQAVLNAAKEGMGIVLLPEVLARGDIAAGKLVPVLADWSIPEQPMSLLFQRDRYQSQRMLAFIEFARSTFQAR